MRTHEADWDAAQCVCVCTDLCVSARLLAGQVLHGAVQTLQVGVNQLCLHLNAVQREVVAILHVGDLVFLLKGEIHL